MAEITRFPAIRHLRGTPTGWVQHLHRGKVAHAGTGLSFWFMPLSAVLSEVPVDDRPIPLVFHARTSDFQDVVAQASVTFRVHDPALATTRIDFSISSETGRWRSTPLEGLAGMLTEAAQEQALALLAGMTLTETLASGPAAVTDRLRSGLATDPRLTQTGISIVDVRVASVRPEPEVERALQTPTREQVQQEADKATFERRALAVERERAIGENELQTQIELARREEQLVAQRGANARRQAEEAAAAGRIQTAAEADREQRLAEARAQSIRVRGEAEGAAETARVGAYRGVSEGILLGLALRELASNLPRIGNLVLTPDLLTPVLARLGAGSSEVGATKPQVTPGKRA
jgi:regulator of protease activity HflC (stomatin/prohibitin superfamily)